MPETVPLGPSLRRIRCTLTAGRAGPVARNSARPSPMPWRRPAERWSRAKAKHEVAGQSRAPVGSSRHSSGGDDGRGRRPGGTAPTARRHRRGRAIVVPGRRHRDAGRPARHGGPDGLLRPADRRLPRPHVDAACRIVAALAAAGLPGTAAAAVLQAGERVAHLGGHDDAWRVGSAGPRHRLAAGRAAVAAGHTAGAGTRLGGHLAGRDRSGRRCRHLSRRRPADRGRRRPSRACGRSCGSPCRGRRSTCRTCWCVELPTYLFPRQTIPSSA